MAAELKLKRNMPPVFIRKRYVPFASLDKINQVLDRLENIGILSKTEYNQWASPVVNVKKKSGEIRADFSTGLNTALEDFHYPLPSPKEVFIKLNGSNFISKIDLSNAYLQIPVNSDIANLLSINTHRGLYRYERLAFGVKVAPAIFQQVMDTMLGGLDFAIAYLDDIIIASRNMEQHTDHIYQVFKRLQDYGFKVKENNCKFFLQRIKYLGNITDKDGRRPGPDRAPAIKDMPAPENTTQLQSFLGLANYYQSFIPKMHLLRAPLNPLLKKDKRWEWTTEYQAAFEEIKKSQPQTFSSHTLTRN